MISDYIQTSEDLKRETATLGMALWTLKLGQNIPDRERRLALGLQVCDLIATLGKAGTSADTQTFEQAAFIERYLENPERPIRHLAKIKTKESEAHAVRRVIQKLSHYETVSTAELEQSCRFCHQVYDAL